MTDQSNPFAGAIQMALQAADETEKARNDLIELVQSAGQSVKAATNDLVTLALWKGIRRSPLGEILAFKIALELADPEEFGDTVFSLLLVSAEKSDASAKESREVCRVSADARGYPIRLTTPESEGFAEDREALQSILVELLASHRTGVKIRSLLLQLSSTGNSG